jgi:Lrp/AsnC family transcriptional regulator
LDTIDRRILALLQEDATRAVAEIAAAVGLSQTPCWRRIQRLRSDGVIDRTVAILSPEAVGLGLTVFVEIQAHDHSDAWLRHFAATASAIPEVLDVFRMAGETDYLLRVAVRDMAHFDLFYRRLVEAVPMRNVTSRFVMERVKASTAYPLELPAGRRAADT